MRKDIQDALLSVREVALFTWSLLELLLTRILPLAGYLAGHLLLQFCRLLASVLITAAARPEPGQSEYSYDVQAEELIEEDNVQAVKEEGDHENDLEILKSSDERLEERQVKESSILPSLTNDEDADHVEAAATPAATDATATITLHVPETSVPSDGQIIQILSASDAAANEVQLRGSDYEHVADTERFDLGSNVAGEEQRHVSANPEGSSSTEGDEMRKSRRRMRVLPPSLSQIKRTLMQRSRRASASPSPSPSPAGSTPSPMKKKSPRRRKLASPAIKSSSSYDNFMGKFRKHFLLDPATPM